MAKALISHNSAVLCQLTCVTTLDINHNLSLLNGGLRPIRKRAIIVNPKELAAEFANAVTEYSSNQMDWVARNGDESLFSTLTRIMPEVFFRVTIESSLEFNKSHHVHNLSSCS